MQLKDRKYGYLSGFDISWLSEVETNGGGIIIRVNHLNTVKYCHINIFIDLHIKFALSDFLSGL